MASRHVKVKKLCTEVGRAEEATFDPVMMVNFLPEGRRCEWLDETTEAFWAFLVSLPPDEFQRFQTKIQEHYGLSLPDA